ncbi:galactoside alpha-(1,2)-fucosyltransferase 2-like isoform X2 [Hyla sarda]|uniref:galactoside alpha-(1,2)-fucosyltransferase 2-like isoform X2 n=1 Tax=Hyla sarda TaxID=327740 RepID=UPI0024C45DF1|nr:galactoside alpha-(1,2)-fucosyltransferase 2-like isoform X2 [Hyla sarda]XP_056399181.1 galactoside alpha-(1,2)-fucosyltransferase 2-like isoform X2 [Hyla sarda]XP_056399183.1 galactoside alpha-(1,2)-fucosyltransferase 2-like isoform X2 [Hyla sarda]XP_056399184.1 galactoside alpha-(1,2)-fucosyltransferase 2-like isoform X2 [Hyla sarda]XP_056399185.1 galactoside alpha-(1,2)-fucosyltransferase 2-like isoform X2 [Hyla sarda]XP_056399186.1 galactoside alpha-(1,2)-fucosyltransferase 2-like isofo
MWDRKLLNLLRMSVRCKWKHKGIRFFINESVLPSRIQERHQTKMELPKKKKKLFLLGCLFMSVLTFFVLYRLQKHIEFLTFSAHLPISLICPEEDDNKSSEMKKKESYSTENEIVAKCKHSGIWTIKPEGRLGNQIGEYAALYALAKANRRQAFILADMFNYLSPIFKITLPVLHNSVARHVPFKEYWIHDWMSEEYNHIEESFIKLTGFPCSWTFFHHIREDIQREFTIHDHLKNEASQVLESIKGSRKNVTYIGVHVRRGDYVNVMPNVWKGVVADKGYLEKAMNYFRNKYKEPVFVVTSNGMTWCKENIDNSKGDVYFSGDGNESTPGKDFALLVGCNHTIMTIGTFGFWASYLVGGETIYLTNFTLPESEFLKLFHYDAAFLPEWMGIPADLSPLRH